MTEAERDHFVGESVDAVARRGTACRREASLGSISSRLVAKGARLLESDKEGFFVVLEPSMFTERAVAAVRKNFKEVRPSGITARDRALDICSSWNLGSLATAIKKKEHTLKLFFAAKTHKPGVPFRSTVSERGSWQVAVSGFLQKHLESLNITDPFSV